MHGRMEFKERAFENRIPNCPEILCLERILAEKSPGAKSPDSYWFCAARLKSRPDAKHKSRIDDSQKIRKNFQKRLATHSDQSQSMPKEQ